ncbi:MAG: matrix protein [Tomato betanucleorhabdovirus 1]|uniref:Matrix protein n=1 Tax=Tomato betanucleorhabdovirus 1 TaxID=2950850 RepID=A0AAE9SG70_9RHAB|nr:MAG: matrix protein [Tomato betanucleorhabdovirus 1]
MGSIRPTYHTLFMIIILIPACLGDNPFEVFQKSALQSNPVREAEHRVGYGSNSIQPYYICDREDSGGAMPLSAWHYSCKQSCKEDNKKTHITLTKTRWNFIGPSISVYKVVANKVCYTSHENIWGYCTQAQTVEPTSVTEEDRKSLPKEYSSKDSKILGVTNIINSKHAECSYLSDNTHCTKDFVITYREGKLSKKSSDDPLVLNIYGDGIRTDPASGSLYNNDAAWIWNIEDIVTSKDCGWSKDGDTVCRLTSSSELMHCPDIGYQYNIHTLKSVQTCIGEVYDKDGPMPFLYGSQQETPSREDVMNKAKEGKGDPDINMITGINTAFDEIEETYCAASCDLFARGPSKEDNYVLETPIGNWRLITRSNGSQLLSPCKPTATWRIKSPSTICHGKDHLLVEDSKTHHTCSWDTTKDYIISEELCNTNQAETDADDKTLRETIASNQELRIHFWTGDQLVMKPPYTSPTWEKSNASVSVSPGWFSKVGLNRGMLHNQLDISHIMTALVESTKQEVMYNATKGKTIRTLLADEILGGASEIWTDTRKIFVSLLSTVPKVLIMILAVIIAITVLKLTLEYYLKQKLLSKVPSKVVTFVEDEMDDFKTPLRVPSAPKKRMRSRSSRLSEDLSFI